MSDQQSLDPQGGAPPRGHTSRTGSGGVRWQPPSAEALQRELANYEVLSLLGHGGMGAVYKGRQTVLDRLVAIKILPPGLEADDEGANFAERFKNEARSMAKLSHPGIVGVHDFGETNDGLLYFVMEFVEGHDVTKMIAQTGALPPENAVAITAHVCDALQYAHERGIIHRDIKPANVMVSYEGTVKVADFGLAKMTAGGETAGLTRSGMALGTMHFMAPEALVMGMEVDHRADLYAVGVMLYNMLTGKVPHGAFEMPSVKMPGLDPRFDAIILKAMKEDPDQRYQSAAEMRAALDTLLTQPVVKVEAEATEAPAALPTRARPQRSAAAQPHRPPQPKPKPPSSSGWLVPAALVILALGAGAYWFHGQRSAASQGRQTGDAPSHGRGPAGTAPAVREALDPAPTAAATVSSSSPAPPATMKLQVPAPTSGAVASPAPQAAMPSATKNQPFVNTLGMKFVPLPGTDLLMCVHETRYSDYAAFAAESPGIHDAWKSQSAEGFAPTERTGDHPVFNVSWEDARSFCVWLSKKEGRTFRLPTDAEWSIAAGIGQYEKWEPGSTPASVLKEPNEYPWGTSWPPPKGAGNYADASRHAKVGGDKPWLEGYDDTYPTTAPVMSFEPNKAGLYDLGGNLWEWVEDWNDDTDKKNVSRGGSWENFNRPAMLTSARGLRPPGARNAYVGFRVVVEPAAAPAVSATSSSAAPPAAMRPQVPAPAASPATLQDLPDFRTRIAAYQKARHAKLSDFTSKYRAALATAKADAIKGGVLSEVDEVEAALAGAATFAGTVEKNLGATEVTPLPAPAPPGSQAPANLKRLHEIFERETAAIESALAADLDKSLYALQTTLVRASDLTMAKAAEEYRRQMTSLFQARAPAPAASPGGIPGTSVPPAPSPASQTAPPTSVLSFGGHRYQAVPGKESWLSAKARAEGMGGHLVVITTKEENDWIRSTFVDPLADGTMLWIGASNTGQDGKWKWVTGEGIGFEDWVPKALLSQTNIGVGFIRNMTNVEVTNVTGWALWQAGDKVARRNVGLIVEWDDAPASPTPTGRQDAAPASPAASMGPAPATPAVPATAGPGAATARKAWPTGPNFRSEGRFRAWSSQPRDPAMDLRKLRGIDDAVQVYVNSTGWLVLRQNGEVLGNLNDVGALKDIKRICRGNGDEFALITRKGEMIIFPARTDAVSKVPEGLGPVKDAYVSTNRHVALLEDGGLVAWGLAHDGIERPGNPEWKDKPVLPPGRTAVAMSNTPSAMGLRTDDGKIWRWGSSGGMSRTQGQFDADPGTPFVMNNLALYGIPKSDGPILVASWRGNDPATPFPGDLRGRDFIGANGGGRNILVLDQGGRIVLDPMCGDRSITAALDFVSLAERDLISVHLPERTTPVARVLWFDKAASATPATSQVKPPAS